MLDWRIDVEVNLMAFCEENGLSRALFSTEYYPAPHKPPPLPYGNMGVYGFWMERLEGWLKIGKLGPNSQPRSVSHHYLEGNAASCLPRSVRSDPEMREVSELDRYQLREWIKENFSRMNILMPAGPDQSTLLRLEKFLHCRLQPRYEGGRRGGRFVIYSPPAQFVPIG